MSTLEPHELDWINPVHLVSAIVQASDDAVIVSGPDGTILAATSPAATIHGYEPGELAGQCFSVLVPAEFSDEHARLLSDAVSGRLIPKNDTTHQRKDGSRVSVRVTAAPVVEDGRVTAIVWLVRDMTAARVMEREALRLAAIVSSSDDAIVSKDLRGTILTWNRAAERMFGYTPEEAIGRPITIIIPEERLEEERTVLTRIAAGLPVEHFETVRIRKDGQPIEISLTVSPIKTPSGVVIGASKIAREITEQRRLARQVEHAARLKDEFLATLSHELRTPLNAILGYARMLRLGALAEDRRQHAVEIIERNAGTLTQLVDDVLDVSRIVAGKIRLAVQTCDVAAIVELAIDSVRPTYEAKGVRLERILDPDAGPVWGDPDRLQQVVWNLLTNAVKFTGRGGRVQVRLSRMENDVELTVSDTGIGIAPHFLPHLFERFSQADSRSTREFGGLGLGLSLVRHFVELHGGSVDAFSEGVGHGATFRVRLPLMIEQPRRTPAIPLPVQVDRSAPPETRPLEGVIVLAVDDDPDSLLLVSDALRTAGASVVAARSAEEGLQLFEGLQPDVIVSDLSMPVMDGYDFIRQIRARGERDGRTVPAAALTAYARSEDRIRALMAGYQTYLAKPIDPGELVKAVTILGRQRASAR